MGAVVLVLGRSGSGKSTSLRNFKKEDVGIFNTLGKPLPFKGGSAFPQVEHGGYREIINTLAANNKRCYIVDDATYLMQNENFARANEKGYDKFTDMAVHMQQLFDAATRTDKDTITYVIMHVEEDANGREKVKTIGKMLDEKYCIEGAAPMVLDCVARDGKHLFVTENDGINLAKSPMGMLPPEMDNDLAQVDTIAREYWGMASIHKTKKDG